MTETRITAYEMNPQEDTLMYGDELRDGMWVIPDDAHSRPGVEASEDVQLRGQRFCRVTRLRDRGIYISFIGVYVDGFQKSWGPLVHKDNVWIVKREHPSEPEI